MVLFQSEPQVSWIPVVALFANGLEVDLVKLGFDGHLLIAGGAGKVVDTPGLVEGGEHVALDHLVADVTKVPKHLVVVGLAVCQPLALVVTVPQKWFLALGTDKVLHMPMLSEGSDDTFFYGPSAGATYRYPHLVMAPEAVEFIQFVGCVSWPCPDLSCCRCQLRSTPGTVEVVGVVNLTSETQRVAVDHGVALLTHISSGPFCLDLCVAFPAESPSLIFNEAKICQLFVTHLTGEALRVPGRVHGLDHSSHDELPAFSTAWGKQDMEVMLAVFPALELVEYTIRKGPETLGAYEAGWVEKVSIGVDYLCLWFKTVVTPSAGHAIDVHDAQLFNQICIEL